MTDQTTIDAIGYLAAALVLAAFSARSMRALRWTAIASNLAFIAYGSLGGLAPVLLLHALLLPVNAYRLVQLGRVSGGCRPDGEHRVPVGRRTREPDSRLQSVLATAGGRPSRAVAGARAKAG